MFAFYDLAVSPVSFDMAQFLVCAKAVANRNGAPLHVVIVPGTDADGFRPNDHKPIDAAEKRYRINHILLPLVTAIGATFTLAPSRPAASSFVAAPGPRFPDRYTVENPIGQYLTGHPVALSRQGFALPTFEPTERAKQIARQWLAGREKVVTIGLRETFTPTRNSDVSAWLAFGHWLEEKGFSPVLLRDTDKMTEGDKLDGLPCFNLGSCDVDLRLGIYDAAIMNCSVNNGPFVVNTFSKRPWIVVRVTSPPMVDEKGRKHFVTTVEYMASQGLPEGSQYPHAHDRQRLYWVDDTFENIKRAFCETLPVAE